MLFRLEQKVDAVSSMVKGVVQHLGMKGGQEKKNEHFFIGHGIGKFHELDDLLKFNKTMMNDTVARQEMASELASMTILQKRPRVKVRKMLEVIATYEVFNFFTLSGKSIKGKMQYEPFCTSK